MATLLERLQGCLLGLCVGDAAGAPIEGLEGEYLRTLSGGMGFIPFLEKPNDWSAAKVLENYAGPKSYWHDELRKVLPGDTTDDTALTKVVAESLIAKRGWDLRDCAERHRDAFIEGMNVKDKKNWARGWGRTTRAAMIDLRDGKQSMIEPAPRGKPGTGCGNGPLMKVAPLGMFFEAHGVYKFHELLRERVMAMSSMTHWDPRAGIAAYAGATTIAQVLRHPLCTYAQAEEFLRHLVAEVEYVERQYRDRTPVDGERLSARLRYLSDVIGIPGDVSDLRSAWGATRHALVSLPFALGIFFRNLTNFEPGILEAVNSGGDTDTHAAIVGAMIGANCGVEAIPEAWREYRPEYRDALALGEQLYDAARQPVR